MKRTALIIGSGGLKGAYSAGVASALDIAFDGYYGSSVGVFATTFHLTRQRKTIENTFKNHIDGTKLVNPTHALKRNGTSILNLEYLIDTFQNEISRLDVDAIFDERGFQKRPLTYIVTNMRTGEPEYLRPEKNTIFSLMIASSAAPLIHPPVRINGNVYLDGAISDSLPVRKAFEDGYEKVIAVSTRYNDDEKRSTRFFLFLASFLYPKNLARTMRARKRKFSELKRYVESNPCIHVIKPSMPLPLKSMLDTSRERLVETFEIGKKDAQEFLRNYRA